MSLSPGSRLGVSVVKAVKAVVVFVSVFFLFVGTVKLTGVPQGMFDNQMSQYFIPFGLNRPIVFLIGLAEVSGAIAIWFHRSHWIGLAGAATLVVVTSGALFFHLRFDTFREGVPALVMLLLSAFVLAVSARADRAGDAP